MKHTTRKMTAVLLALSLLVGMMTLFSASASAASNLTVQVTSNLPALFPDADIAMDESTKMVKVTYYINTPDYKIMNCEWTLEYDGTKLTPELRTGGLNVDIDEKGEITLTQDQMQKIEDQLKTQDDACKEAKTLIDTLKAENKQLKDDVDAKTQEINDLKAGAGETGNGGAKVEDEGLNGAAELWNSIKGA